VKTSREPWEPASLDRVRHNDPQSPDEAAEMAAAVEVLLQQLVDEGRDDDPPEMETAKAFLQASLCALGRETS